MKEGIQIKDSAVETTKKRRRRRTNFTGSKQRRRNNQKRREGTFPAIPKTAQDRKGKGTRRLESDLEPISEDREVTDSSSLLGRSPPSATIEGEVEMGEFDSQNEFLGSESESESQDAGGESRQNMFVTANEVADWNRQRQWRVE